MMARLCLTFVLTFVLFAAVVSASELQAKAKKVAAPKCNKITGDLSKCCNEKENINGFFSATIKTKCQAQTTGELEKFVNKYELQSIEKTALLPNGSLSAADVTKFVKSWAPTACYIECLFKEAKLLTTDGLVNATMVLTYFNETVRTLPQNNKSDKPSSNWIQNASIIAAACADAGDVAPVKTLPAKKPPQTCSVYPLFTMQCFHWVEFFMCPASTKLSRKEALCSGNGISTECNMFDVLVKAYGGSSSANFTVMLNSTSIADKLASIE